MKKLIVYYSYSGNTKEIAKKLAKKENADIFEITDIKKPNKIKAYVVGCFSAMRMKPSKINPISKNMDEYDIITFVSPVWAGHPVPQINAVIQKKLPPNKKIQVILVSASGQSSAEDKLKKILNAKNCELTSYENIKA